MELAYGVRAVSSDGCSWEFKSELVKSVEHGEMFKVGSGKSEFYVVSLPFYGSTKNQMFKSRDDAFAFVNKFILSEV